ncbi:SR-related and CTD-associated factor 4-like isoform X1 [Gadus chalcogrammus]|uniref:SR-related and CTD-associated factor 4-like isoform X1 n=1 Tax=Gadus chalcogrammus TaxID=1042646 RepID=UPI0024C47F30|nr:SR-related and CTD-associated factor 4-like isoform X1 [Gadus chalcogrammus]
MDAVNAFNMELFSMIEMKPPISRAKMMSVTKSAIKAIKLYKHVVQIVEKFIKKCKPDLKVPGLYVVDSIIRQSRHQFGVEKDVFAPRFLKNFTDTFNNLYLCSEDDKCKILRVLNLWQKNGVFDMDIIQPLLDMAHGSLAPAHSTHPAHSGAGPTAFQPEPQPPVSGSPAVAAVSQLPNSHALAAVAHLFQTSGGQELQKMLQNLQQGENTQAAMMSNTTVPEQLHSPSSQHHAPASQPNPYGAFNEQKSSLAKKLLDRFDYDDEPEDGRNKESHSLRPPGNSFSQFPGQATNVESSFHPQRMGGMNDHEHGGLDHSAMMQDCYPPMNDSHARGGSREDASSRREGRQKGFGRRSRSGSRSPRRRRSRSTSRTRRSRNRPSGSQSRDKRWKSRSCSEDRSERERDRERRQKGLPNIKGQTLSVCSTTLWVGQLDKRTQQSDVMSLLEEFGQIDSVNMIPPRGCAYIVMVHRQDANTALHKLSSGLFKVNQKPIKIAWALNKGIKSTHKKFWDVERGVTYIPWNKVKVDELESFREGGMLDMDSINPDWGDVVQDLKPAALNGGLEAEQVAGTGGAPLQVPLLAQQHATAMGGPPGFPAGMLSPGGAPPYLSSRFDPSKLQEGFSPPAARRGRPSDDSSSDAKPSDAMSPDSGADSRLGSPGPQSMSVPPGHRPGMPPHMHSPPPGMGNPHMPPFLPGPNMGHVPPQMMYPPDRYHMHMPFPPRGPPFPPRGHPMGPDRGGPFRNGGPPGFGGPPFLRGRW